jgi:hypothetical protein
MWRTSRHVYATARQLDEEQDVQALEPHGLDRKEIGRKHCVGMRAKELTPR